MPATWAWMMLYYRLYYIDKYGLEISYMGALSLSTGRSIMRYRQKDHSEFLLKSRMFPEHFRPKSDDRRVTLERWVSGQQVWVSPDWDEIQLATAQALLQGFDFPGYDAIRNRIVTELSQKECK
jgi:hypothetical protein